MSRICLCLTGKTIARDLEALEKYRKYIDCAELRVDCLENDERLAIRRFPGLAGLPVILTIRRRVDGGLYEEGEGARMVLFARALAFAETDMRHNFAYVDFEDDINVPSIEEAARTFGTRIIRSRHNISGVDERLAERLRGMRRMGDEIVKAAMRPNNLDETLEVWRAAKETADMDKILLCMGEYGVNTRILAEKMGAFLSYTSPRGEDDLPQAAPGQLDPRELAEDYRFKKISTSTRVFGVTGFPLRTTDSPAFFNTVFDIENVDAVYIPFPSVTIESFLRLGREIGIEGASITVPHKQAVLPHLTWKSEQVRAIGACNTIAPRDGGLSGWNTDALGFSGSLLAFLGRKNLRGWRVTLVGAGGAASAVAFELHRLHAKTLVINRGAGRARDLAARYGFQWALMDRRGFSLMERFNDLIVQTTPLGMAPDTESDPIDLYTFQGKEVVMDLIYKPEKTLCLKRAEAAGCRILSGADMLRRQAQYQYPCFFGKEFPATLVQKMR
ncbi:MAG: type I 3-dehydroquinate dehydratase [Treponema sp.]|jgi:3-dehydroquinate dehydratase/shikimate dehydrogenase|nr:type I 3-dehydroquinate dehydratase [Treponema sp.]